MREVRHEEEGKAYVLQFPVQAYGGDDHKPTEYTVDRCCRGLEDPSDHALPMAPGDARGYVENNDHEARSRDKLLLAEKKIKKLEKELKQVREENAVLNKAERIFPGKSRSLPVHPATCQAVPCCCVVPEAGQVLGSSLVLYS